MSILNIILLFGVVLLVLPSILMNLPIAKKHFQKMDDRKLIDSKVTAQMIIKLLIIVEILTILVFGFIAFIPNISAIANYLTYLILLSIISLSAATSLYWHILRIAKVEIEYRKFKNERTGT